MNKNITTDLKTILAEKSLDGDSQMWQKRLETITTSDVERALSEPAGFYHFKKLLAFISPAAENYL